MVRDGSLYRLVSDHLGSPRIVIDATTGAVAQRLDYDEFGRILFDSNPGFQPFGFGGGIYDASTGLIRFGARDYDPATGRWTAKDPLHLAGGDFNLYTYAHNDPVNLLDPTGLAVLYCGVTGEVITPSTATAVGDAFIWIDSDGNYGTGLAGGLGGGVGSPGAAAMIGFSTASTGAAYAGEGGQFSLSSGAVGGGVTRAGSKFWGLEATLSPLDGAGGYSVATGTLIQERGNLGDDVDNFQRAMEENWDRLVQAFKDLVDPAKYVPELVPSDECGSCR
jgi:RHS repeat-associated protein